MWLAAALLIAEAVPCLPGAAQGSRVAGAQIQAPHRHEHADMREHAVHARAKDREVEPGASLTAPCPCGCDRASRPASSGPFPRRERDPSSQASFKIRPVVLIEPGGRFYRY